MPSVAPENNEKSINSDEFISQKLKEIDEKEHFKKQSEKIIIENEKKPEIINDNKVDEKVNESKLTEPIKQTNPNLRIGGKDVKLSDIKKSGIKDDLDSVGIFKSKKTIFYIFAIPPVTITIISFFHLITYYMTGNPDWIAYCMAFAIEIASISSLMALAFLNKIKKFTIILLFTVILLTQLLGNMFYSFLWLKTSSLLPDILSFFNMNNDISSLRILSFLVSGIPVLISLAFIKSIINLFRNE